MKFAIVVLTIALVLLGVTGWVAIHPRPAHAQNVALTPSVLTMASTAVAANCPTPVAGITTYCFGADKMQVSPNGGAYVVIWPAGAVAAGVTSFNGRTGAVMPVASDYPFPPAPVTSVNGKTGAVVLGAVATAPAVTVQ